MKAIYYIETLLLAAALSCCKGEEMPEPIKVLGTNQASILVLSPNSPVLIADGKSMLSFSGDFFYTTPETKDSLFRLPSDRVDQSMVMIESSDGKTFSAAETYSTIDPTRDQVTFTAKYGTLTSKPVTINLYPKSEPITDRKEIPVTIYLFTSDKTESLAKDLTDTYLYEVMDEVNKICDGSGYAEAPTKGDLGVKYVVKSIKREKVSSEKETRDYLTEFCQRKSLYDKAEEMLYIMIITPSTTSPNREIAPKYTYGDPALLPGVREEGLTHISNLDEIKESLTAADICIDLSFTLLQTYSTHVAATAVAYRLGLFYGLLNTDIDSRFTDPGQSPDIDYCPDTFTTDRIYTGVDMVTIPLADGQVFRYRPFHVMEGAGPGIVFTADQAKRIKAAMRTVPFRGQAYR